jgi:pimeloyl-ACP methyl ester carboxylesterase
LERNDVDQWTKWLQGQSEGCVYLFGESMGAAIALQAAAMTPGLCAAAVESSFSSFREIAYDRISQTTGVSLTWSKTLARPMLEEALLYTRLRYGVNLADAQPRRALSTIKVPVLLIGDDADHNIPPRHAALLMRSAQSNDAIWHVPRADQGGASSVAPTEFQTKVLGWFHSHQACVRTNQLSFVNAP